MILENPAKLSQIPCLPVTFCIYRWRKNWKVFTGSNMFQPTTSSAVLGFIPSGVRTVPSAVATWHSFGRCLKRSMWESARYEAFIQKVLHCYIATLLYVIAKVIRRCKPTHPPWAGKHLFLRVGGSLWVSTTAEVSVATAHSFILICCIQSFKSSWCAHSLAHSWL